MPAATVDQIADWFISQSHEAGDPITNLKLQKLVYYAQAWYVAQHDDVLIAEPFQAWLHGPVCPPLYQRFKDLRWNAITAAVAPPKLPPGVEEHLAEVLEVYGGFSAWDLERLSHTEQPWMEARAGIPADANCEREISVDAMRRFYRPRLNGSK